MKKISNIFLYLISSLLLINWSKEISSPKYCSGTIYFSNQQNTEDQDEETTLDASKAIQEEVVDIKIGISPEFCDNQNIVVFRKPKNHKKNPIDYIEYKFDLEKVKEITTNQKNPIYKFNNDEYVNITVKHINNSESNYIIPKSNKIISKVKKTGAIASYPFDVINKLVIESCVEKEKNN